ncbi:nitroreductase family protein [Clostridium sp. D2Q-11]|uniref:Nitroreductase family protein n=1 Tax=Anaeromonas frigoriresistens TaxID=2683708 RepID=A0A942V2W4_9FIRM|nr:nitroreductase family protein [Anaeromonas frigoriresistens]MBS4540132.1 nitroreductase family protein [Anaeromonas frigoriresistens]
MLFSKFLENRRSTREYSDKMVENDKLEMLMDFAEKLQSGYGNDGIRFILYEDGEKIYENLKGVAGYAGVMINSPHYIGLQTDNEDKETIIKAAYAMETLLTKAYQLDLGSCWINIMDTPYDSKEILFNGKNKHINYIVAIGYSKDKSKISQIANSNGLENEDIGYLNTIRPFKEKKYFVEKSTSSRLSVKDIVFDSKFGKSIDPDELDKRGLDELFYYVRYAPSNKNKQPWRFILKNNKVNLAVIDPKDKNNLTDAGIMMYYFEEMAKSIGFKSSWDFIEGDIQEEDGITFSILGEYKL